MPKNTPPSEPPAWLRLSCCHVGRLLTVRWLRAWLRKTRSGHMVSMETCRTQEEATDGLCDWTLTTPQALFGEPEAVRIRHCPGCGATTPRLKKRATSTYHPANYDPHTGTCLTCGVRYCAGQDPGHVYEVEEG